MTTTATTNTEETAMTENAPTGHEPAELPDLLDCRFHGGRGLARHDTQPVRRTVHCGGCGQLFARTPSENRAIDASLPVVALVRHEIQSILFGGNLITTLLDGTEVLLRMASPQEFQAVQHAAVENGGGDPADKADRKIGFDQAVTMVEPLEDPRARRGW